MQITELAAKLQSLGLADKESRVYVAALFLGSSTVQKIASQASINRATAYTILDQLAELGLVSQSQEGKKTVFVAEPPEALERLFDRQREEVEARRRELVDLLPELHQTQRVADGADAPVVRFYKGREGVININNELRRRAEPGTEVYAMSNLDEAEKVIPNIFKTNPSARVKKRLSSRLIYSYRKDIPGGSKLMRETVKVQGPIMADVGLYEDTASLCTYSGKDSIGIVIESPEIVGVLRQLFEMAWKNKQS